MINNSSGSWPFVMSKKALKPSSPAALITTLFVSSSNNEDVQQSVALSSRLDINATSSLLSEEALWTADRVCTPQMSRVKTGNENGSEGARRIRRSNRFRDDCSRSAAEKLKSAPALQWEQGCFQKVPDCSSTGDGRLTEVFAPLHENSSLCSRNAGTSKVPGDGNDCFKVLHKEKKRKKERRDSALQGGFWISTLPRLMLGKRVTKEMGVWGLGQRSKVSEQW